MPSRPAYPDLGHVGELRPVHAHGTTCYVLPLRGDLDMSSAALLESALQRSVEPWSTLVLDLGAVGLLDSSALGVLIRAYKRMRAAGGRLRLASAGASVLTVLRLTNTLTLLGGDRPLDAVLVEAA